MITEPYPNPQQRLCLAPFPLSRFGLLTSCCVCPLLSLGPQGQAYKDENHATQSEQPWKAKHVLLKAQRPHFGCFREAYCKSAQGCAHTPSMCWLVENIRFSFTWEDPSSFCGFLLQTGGGGQENHPSSELPICTDMYRGHTRQMCPHALRVPPTHTGCCGCSAGIGASSPCRNWQHHLLKRAVRITESQALLLHQCRGVSADVMSVPHWKEAIAGPLLQAGCVSLHTGEVSRVAAERTGTFIRGTQSVWFEHELCSAALLFLSLQCSHTGPQLQNTDVKEGIQLTVSFVRC